MKLRWTSHFKKSFEKISLSSPATKDTLSKILLDLTNDPFQTHLKTHKLKGDLKDCWACYVEYDVQIVFTFVTNETTNEQEILLLNIGTHDEVYWHTQHFLLRSSSVHASERINDNSWKGLIISEAMARKQTSSPDSTLPISHLNDMCHREF